jgi:hypothetical protein
MECNTFGFKEDITIEFYYTKAKYKGRQEIKIKQVYIQFGETVIVSENKVEYHLKDLTDFSF